MDNSISPLLSHISNINLLFCFTVTLILMQATSAQTCTCLCHKQQQPTLNKKKNLLARINASNRDLGIFFGLIVGAIIGIILVTQHKVTISIIGVPDSMVWYILTVFLCAGTAGNLCSYIGLWFDILLGEWTIFDGMKSVYRKVKPEEQTQT